MNCGPSSPTLSKPQLKSSTGELEASSNSSPSQHVVRLGAGRWASKTGETSRSFVQIDERPPLEWATDLADPTADPVLVLRDLEDLDEERVAAVLAVPAGTVRSRPVRARRNFKDRWSR